jgi:DNA-binding transcriptional LysR family regulator
MAVDLSNIPDLGSPIARRARNCLAMVPLGREVFHAVMPRQHLLAPSRGVTMKQIAREPLVSLPNDSRTRRTIDAAASRQDITLQHAVTVTQLATVMSFVRAGLGVAIVPADAIAGFNTDGLKTLPIIRTTLSHNWDSSRSRNASQPPRPSASRR